jgi:hypothetical protein
MRCRRKLQVKALRGDYFPARNDPREMADCGSTSNAGDARGEHSILLQVALRIASGRIALSGWSDGIGHPHCLAIAGFPGVSRLRMTSRCLNIYPDSTPKFYQEACLVHNLAICSKSTIPLPEKNRTLCQ